MRTIYKYELKVDTLNEIPLPSYGVKILSVGNQRDNLCMWVEQESSETLNKYTGKPHILKERYFLALGTGHEVVENLTYIGTAIIEPYVWHVYEYMK